MLWGGIAALSYAAMNVLLRVAAPDSDPFLAAFVRTLPIVTYSWAVVIGSAARPSRGDGRSFLPPLRYWPTLIGIGLVYNVTGNAGFQTALTLSGLAITVPITQGAVLWGGALAGRFVLGEPINWRTVVGIGLLIGALVSLTAGAGNGLPHSQGIMVIVAVLAATLAGLSYGGGNAVFRRTMASGLGMEQALCIITLTGMLSTGSITVARIGLAGALATPPAAALSLLLAGLANAVGLYSIAKALQITTVNRANSMNSAQIALSALAGLALFSEPVTAPLIVGLGLTIAGLALIQRPSSDKQNEVAVRQSRRPSPHPARPNRSGLQRAYP